MYLYSPLSYTSGNQSLKFSYCVFVFAYNLLLIYNTENQSLKLSHCRYVYILTFLHHTLNWKFIYSSNAGTLSFLPTSSQPQQLTSRLQVDRPKIHIWKNDRMATPRPTETRTSTRSQLTSRTPPPPPKRIDSGPGLPPQE